MARLYYLIIILLLISGYARAQDAYVNRSIYDWENYQGNPSTVEAVEIGFSIAPNSLNYGQINTTYGAFALVLGQEGSTTATTNITFDVGEDLYDLCIPIYGINGDDQVIVSGRRNGIAIASQITTDGATQTYCFTETIDQIEVFFGSTATDATQQYIAIGNFGWCSVDADLDGIANVNDPDSDNDGILDTDEDNNSSDDANNNGIPDFAEGTDANGNGINDALDPDNDGLPNSLDIDSDGDGIVDNVEAQATATYVAPSGNDTDGDGLDDAYDGSPITIVNTGGGALPDYLDLDSDGDGVSDLIEGNDIDANGVVDIIGGAISGSDGDGDGLDDSFDAVFGRGVADNATGRNTVPANLVDDDDEYDFRDTDDDGDGVLTSAELTDDNGDGRPEYIQACEDGSILDFEEYAVGDEPGPVFSIDGVDITFDFQDATGNVTNYKISDDVHQEHYVEINQIMENSTQYSLLKVKFDRPLEGFCFDLLDIDHANGLFTDYMSVNVFRDGDVLVLNGENILTGSSNELLDNNFVIGRINTQDADYFANVRVCLGQTVDSLVIRYADANSTGNGQKVGLNDFTWCGVDNDFDEVLDFVDNDDNNNGIPDIIEAGNIGIDPSADADGDKIPNYQDTDFAGFADANGDGIDDRFDLDDDGVPDHLDLDTDNDGIPDAVEANGSTLPDNMDTDGRYPASYASTATDADGDGILAELDPDEGGTLLAINNSDNDPLPDFRDKDSDNDGLTDAVEAGATDADGDGYTDDFSDADNDGYNDYYDPDFFGEELLNGALVRSSRDTDGDKVPDYRDQDADGDGIPDNVEAQSTAGYVAAGTIDSDGDGLVDEYDTDDDDGIVLLAIDTDDDDRADYRDTDSDNDGVADRIEGWDAEGNGRPDTSPANQDTDQDGLDDNYDSDAGGTVAPTPSSDADNIPDYRDIDDDNDGVLTKDEDANSNNNYRDDFVQGGSPTPDYLYNSDDPDGDTIPNDIDTDDNNDGISDVDQSYGVDPSADADTDGTPNYADADYVHPTYGAFIDTNSDGINDIFDVDRDGVPNHFDLDSDGDGIPNAYEANNTVLPTNMTENGRYPAAYARANDADGDGVVNDIDPDFAGGTPLPNQDRDGDGFADALDQDADGDAIPDRAEAGGSDTNDNGLDDTFRDTDGDSVSDYRDTDTDGDGIPDLIESQTTAFATPDGNDDDRDGLDDRFDSDSSGTDIIANDHDGDGTPDFRDTDSDNDGISDAIEGNDSDKNGVADTTPTGTDTDGDGLDNRFDPDNGGGAVPRQNTDGDAEPDYRDNDDDGDGILTFDESTDENPNDGEPDYLVASTEGCGTGLARSSAYGQAIVQNEGGVRSNAATGRPDYDGAAGSFTRLAYTNSDGDFFDLDVGEIVAAGATIDLVLSSNQNNSAWTVSSSLDGTTFANASNYDNLVRRPAFETREYTVPTGGIRYLRFAWRARLPYLDGVVFTGQACIADNDNDEVADIDDNDSDNDGLSDTQEGNGTDPSADADGDGIPNYLDNSFTGFEDVNGDGVSDIFDFDRDGIANHLDLDSDNDGIPDAVEANGGVRPANVSSEGAYTVAYVWANDTDGDGYANDVDVTDGGTAVANPDSDGDGLNDFTDRDSDNDGITDALEAGGTDRNRDGVLDGFADTDRDGLPDSVDPDNGGTVLSIANSDGTDQPDYLDTDSDNDSNGSSPGLPDIFEGHDGNFDGTPSWDDNGNLTLDANEGNVDLDGDGILDAFDPSEGGIGASLPDVDRDGRSNFRDDDDDDDGIPTASEDANGNGNFFDDKTEGQPGTRYDRVPDYLYNPVSPLPVELLDFSAYWNREVVMLRWKTASERDNDRFEIQRSTDGITFSTVGTVKGQGTTQELTEYEYPDGITQRGVFYYRLKQIDFNGESEYSPIKYVFVDVQPVSATVYPNPVQNKFTVKISGTKQPATYMLIDTMGRSFLMGTFSEKETIDISAFPTGKYILRLRGDRLLESINILKVSGN